MNADLIVASTLITSGISAVYAFFRSAMKDKKLDGLTLARNWKLRAALLEIGAHTSIGALLVGSIKLVDKIGTILHMENPLWAAVISSSTKALMIAVALIAVISAWRILLGEAREEKREEKKTNSVVRRAD